MGNSKELKKSIGFFTALSTVIGIVIGSGVFFKPNAVFSATGAPGLGILAWVLAGIITIAAGLTVAELAAAIPKTGGMVVYLKEIYGDKTGFLTGWMMSVLFYPGLISAVAVIFATEVCALIGVDQVSLVAIITIVFLAFANSLGSKTGGAIQSISTVCKLVPLFLIMILGFVKGDGSVATSLTPMVNPDVNTVTALGAALLGVLFAYEGWLSVGNLAGEMKNPQKDLPKAIIIGIFMVMFVYVAINIAYLWVLPADQLAASATPASDVARILFGEVGGKFVTIGIIISVFGTLNALILTGPRALFKIAEDKQIPMHNILSKISSKMVPANAIWATAIISSIYALTGSFAILSDITIFVCWVFYILTFVGVIILRKRAPKMNRPYKVPLYPLIPMVAIIGGLYVVISTLFNQTAYAFIGLGITLLGLPIYFVMNNKNAKQSSVAFRK
ncbi:MAG: APC family permease [Peptostreptococcaceae bacterium]